MVEQASDNAYMCHGENKHCMNDERNIETGQFADQYRGEQPGFIEGLRPFCLAGTADVTTGSGCPTSNCIQRASHPRRGWPCDSKERDRPVGGAR